MSVSPTSLFVHYFHTPLPLFVFSVLLLSPIFLSVLYISFICDCSLSLFLLSDTFLSVSYVSFISASFVSRFFFLLYFVCSLYIFYQYHFFFLPSFCLFHMCPLSVPVLYVGSSFSFISVSALCIIYLCLSFISVSLFCPVSVCSYVSFICASSLSQFFIFPLFLSVLYATFIRALSLSRYLLFISVFCLFIPVISFLFFVYLSSLCLSLFPLPSFYPPFLAYIMKCGTD
jgi:hypothetical protein